MPTVIARVIDVPRQGPKGLAYRHPVFALAVVLGATLPATAPAGEGDFFRPLLSAAYFHDSNIFRFAGDSEVPPMIGGESTGNKIQSVNYYLLGAGFLLDWQQSRLSCPHPCRVMSMGGVRKL